MFYWFDCIVLQEHFWDYLWELSETEFFKNPLMVVQYLCLVYFKVIGFDCCLGVSIHGNPKALYGQDLAFRLSGKCKAALQNRKK